MTSPKCTSYTISMGEILELVSLAKEQGYSTDEALSMLVNYGLIENSNEDMD